jgi:hypothetical protein
MEDGNVKTYCWGGATFSHRVVDKKEAVTGTAWETN